MLNKDLKNKPLVEAILEVKWKVPNPESTQETIAVLPVDPHYKLLLGRFFDRMQAKYPIYESLPASQMPDGLISHAAQHRFRASSNGWPLVQIGHGLMTVNETEAYTWKDFRNRSEHALRCLYQSHPSIEDFHIEQLALSYIDAIEVAFDQESVFAFLREKMKTNIKLPDRLFEAGRVSPNPAYLQWESAFPTANPDGLIRLKFGTGRKHQNSAVIWETKLHSSGEQLPKVPDEFGNWLKQAHDLTSDWFFKLIDGELHKRFS